MCTRIAKASIVALGILAGGLPFGPNEFHSQEALADGDIPDPPYQMRGVQAVMVGATFDENAVRALLPTDIKPSEGISGGFNVYQAISANLLWSIHVKLEAKVAGVIDKNHFFIKKSLL